MIEIYRSKCPFLNAYREGRNHRSFECCRLCGKDKEFASRAFFGRVGHECDVGGINIDHLGHNGNKTCFYPYDLYTNDFEIMNEICKRLGLKYHVTTHHKDYEVPIMRVEIKRCDNG